MSIELNKESVEQADASSCQGTNCGTTTGDHSSECLAEAAAGQGWELKSGDLCGRDCPIHKILAEQAGANVGHGHVFPRADGVKMRCGGPGLCSECTADASCARAALAQPSPAQAEAERPEVVAYLFVKPDGTLSMDAVRHKPSQPAVAVMTVAQHDRIVGAMRADRDSWAEQAEQRLADWDEMRKERDAALARVEQQESTIAGMNEAHAKLAGLYEAAQAQHSVPDGYRLIRLEHFAAIKAKINPEQVDAYRGRNIYDEDKVYANWNACRSALDEIKDVFQQIDWDAENELAELLAAAPGKEGV
ncbi:TPA: hypothetical protein L4V11_002705 [Pseudomonas aeruginosa]|nr:hypothetical protein [Pseudomonas aeruginosa]